MNKNTLFAFVLILLSVYFFNSRFYYENILKKPYPYKEKTAVRDNNTPLDRKEEPINKEKKRITAEKEKDDIHIVSESEEKKETLNAEEKAASDTVWIETDVILCGIRERGANIVSIRTKEYHYSTNKNNDSGIEMIELVSDGNVGGANVLIDNKNYDTETFEFIGENKKILLTGEQKRTIEFVYHDEQGIAVRKIFSFEAASYRIGFKVKSPSLDGKRIGIGWKCGITESEASPQGKNNQHEIRKAHSFDGRDVEHIVYKNVRSEEKTGFFNWIGISSKYFLVAFVANNPRNADIVIESFPSTQKGEEKKLDYRIEFRRIGEEDNENFWIYAGPARINELKKYDVKLQKTLYGGWRFLWAYKWFPLLCEMMLFLLLFFEKIFKDYGISIILVTIVVRGITYPLTQNSMKSMTSMRDAQEKLKPKLDAIRKRYKSDHQKMNQEIMALYKKEGVNPMSGFGGCFPMILQMPVLISLFVVLRKAIELRGSSTFLIPWINDLSLPEALPFITPIFRSVFKNGLPLYGDSVGLMPIIMAAVTFIQQKMTVKDPNQKAMVYFMPVMMLVMFNNFPSGVVLYWTFSSALALAQQLLTDKIKKRSALSINDKGRS